MATEIDNLLELDLTADFLTQLGCSPLVAGDTIDLRFHVLDENGAAASLTGAIIAFTLRRGEKDSAVAFQLLTPTDILIDATQTADAASIAGTNTTGRGWFTIKFRPSHEAALSACHPARLYDVRIKFADASVRDYARGMAEVLRPRTLVAELV